MIGPVQTGQEGDPIAVAPLAEAGRDRDHQDRAGQNRTGGDALLVEAARTLSVAAATATVVRALDNAGIATILLKGPSIARLLYPEGGRRYSDVDLLVAEPTFDRALDVVKGLGYSEKLTGFHPLERLNPENAALALVRTDRQGGILPGTVDLHLSLHELPGASDAVWTALWPRTCEMSVGGAPVRVLTAPAVALHVAMHALHHDYEGHPAEDLRRAVDVLSEADWIGAADLATELGLADRFGYALRQFDNAGHSESDSDSDSQSDSDSDSATGLAAALADRLGLPTGYAPPPLGGSSMQLLLSEPSWTRRAMLVWLRLVPTPAKIRYVSGLGRTSTRLQLARAYLRWWWSVVAGLPRAVRYVVSRRSSTSSRPVRSKRSQPSARRSSNAGSAP
jgi:hypothetical protein